MMQEYVVSIPPHLPPTISPFSSLSPSTFLPFPHFPFFPPSLFLLLSTFLLVPSPSSFFPSPSSPSPFPFFPVSFFLSYPFPLFVVFKIFDHVLKLGLGDPYKYNKSLTYLFPYKYKRLHAFRQNHNEERWWAIPQSRILRETWYVSLEVPQKQKQCIT